MQTRTIKHWPVPFSLPLTQPLFYTLLKGLCCKHISRLAVEVSQSSNESLVYYSRFRSDPDSTFIMRAQMLFPAFLFAITAQASVSFPRSVKNGECIGAKGAPGVCVATTSCTSAGGTYISNACPGTPENIKCCVKTSCGSGGQNGDCRWTSQCGAGRTTISNQCPGPANFKCCVDAAGPSTPADPPATPPSPPSGDDLGAKILAKAKEAEGIQCKLTLDLFRMTILSAHVRYFSNASNRQLGRGQLQRPDRWRV